MFNSKIKEMYLSTFGSDESNKRRVQKSYLNKVSDWEENFNKDIGEFKKSEIENLFKNLFPNISSIKSRYNLVSAIKAYLDWYNKNINDNSAENGDFNPSDFDIDNVTIKYYKSLDSFLTDIFNVIYNQTLLDGIAENFIRENWDAILANYNTAIATLLLSWYGLSMCQITNLRDSDVYIGQNSINVDGVKIQVEESAMEILKQIKNTRKYYNSISNDFGEYDTSPYFIKKKKRFNSASVKDTKTNEKFISYKISCDLNNNSLGITFKANTIRENGMFVRAAKKAKESGLENQIMNAEAKVYHTVFDKWTEGVSARKFNILIKQFRIFLRDSQEEL